MAVILVAHSQVVLEKNETSQKRLTYSTLNLHKWAICTKLSAWSDITAKGSRPSAFNLPTFVDCGSVSSL